MSKSFLLFMSVLFYLWFIFVINPIFVQYKDWSKGQFLKYKQLRELANTQKQYQPSQKLKVRLTVYWQTGSGTDSWTSKGQSSTGVRLQDRKSAAVDPKVIPYGSKIVIPDVNLELKAVDTGSAVKKRTASKKLGKNYPVVDVFFECKKEALLFAKNNPMFVEVLIFN